VKVVPSWPAARHCSSRSGPRRVIRRPWSSTSAVPEINDYRLFRDALRTEPLLALEYGRLKFALAPDYPADRTRYVIGKANWVTEDPAGLHERRVG
jgi:hypothetical protein